MQSYTVSERKNPHDELNPGSCTEFIIRIYGIFLFSFLWPKKERPKGVALKGLRLGMDQGKAGTRGKESRAEAYLARPQVGVIVRCCFSVLNCFPDAFIVSWSLLSCFSPYCGS